jgi:hypothetical protein
MACIALKSNGNRCRNYAVLEDTESSTVRGFTCSSHTHYFDNPEKIKRRWLRYAHDANLDAGYLHSHPAQRESIELALANGLVTVSKGDIQNIKVIHNPIVTGRRWCVFLSLVAQYTEGFSPDWNVELWRGCVVQLWHWLQAVGPFEIRKQHIQNLICIRGEMKWWYQGVNLYPDYGDRTIGFDEQNWFEFFNSCLSYDKAWASEFLSQPEEESVSCVKGIVSKGRILDDILLTERLLSWKRGKLAEFKEECRFRIFEFKEDIIATGWHPERFMNWCVDWEEKKDMEERWA